MNSLKTIVVVTTLLAVGYGAHVFLSKPIPHAFAANEAGMATKFGELPYFQKPTVELPDDHLQGPVSLPPLNASNTSTAEGNVSTAATTAPVQLPSTESGAVSAGSPGSPTIPATNLANAMQAQASANQPQTSLPRLPSQTATAAVQTAVKSGPTLEAEQAGATSSLGAAAAQLASHAAFDYRPPANRFEEIWLDAQAKLNNGQLVDALLSLSMTYRDSTLTAEQKDRLVPLLDQLAGSVIYSSDVHMEAPHVVTGGETLESIAAEYRISPAFVVRANQLMSPQFVPGQQLKLVRGPFRAELSVSRRELTMYLGRYYAGRFPVAVGREFPTNLNLLEVSQILPAREYVDPRTGERIAAGDPHNPYGETWIGLRSSQAPDLNNLGFHGCGAAVGASDTRGCLSLNPQDVDDLSAILTVGSNVEVVP